MHGIERTRRLTGPLAQEQGIRRIIVHYSDGRVLEFYPDAGRPVYNEDDLRELEGIFVKASAALEWSGEAGDAAGVGG